MVTVSPVSPWNSSPRCWASAAASAVTVQVTVTLDWVL